MFGGNFSCVMCLLVRYCVSGAPADSLRLKAGEKNRSAPTRATQFGRWDESEKAAGGTRAGINDGLVFTHRFL